MRVLCLLLVLLVTACGTTSNDPKSIGSDTDALKRSPCACGPQFYRHGKWVI